MGARTRSNELIELQSKASDRYDWHYATELNRTKEGRMVVTDKEVEVAAMAMYNAADFAR